MPIKSAAHKALRHSQRRRRQRTAVKTNLKKLSIKFRKAVAAKQLEPARQVAQAYSRALDKAAQQGMIHRNTAARKKSRLQLALGRAAT